LSKKEKNFMRLLIKLFVAVVVVVAVCWGGGTWYLHQAGVQEQQRLDSQPAPVLTTMPSRLDFSQQLADLRYLASDTLAGRGTGQAGGQQAQAWLVQQFEQIGLKPAGSQGFRQPYQAESGKAAEHQGAANVLAMLPGNDPALPAIIITAHYDHLGLQQGQIYHGADDNASGVAALLALARYFRDHPPRHSLWFAALDHEERGMWGAKMLFQQQVLHRNQLAMNINLDMLSRDTGNELYAVGAYHYPELEPKLLQLQQQSAVRLLLGHDRPWWKVGDVPDWTTGSDHQIFHQHGVPFVYFGVPDHADYHRPTDTADRINPEFYRRTSETVLSAVLLFDQP